ncbi:MAG: BlaI/MecI/CopY family transcriptional regulator [Candidatus Nomurabacteria bacterium]|nr:BlaI/MecI/CopY family transcriptional regulator [Candidatus Nomurabacteria bacterium]USN87426.1 MAG: BlaI/MecI/CopY family transcriptional regulator [Candidatus Nomurabacteria bacterium]
MIKEILEELGFSEKEVEIYLAIIKSDQATASLIAKETDVNRTTVYDILETLMHKGVVSKIKKAGKTYYYALSPDKLIDYLEREKREFSKKIDLQKEKVSKIMPKLISIQNLHSVNKPKVRFYEGEKGMREAYEDSLQADGLIRAYANVEEMHKGLPNFFPDYYKRRAEANIHIRAILPQNEASFDRASKDSEEMRTTKFLPEEKMTFSPEINVYNNKVLIASWKESMAIVMESKELADFHKLVYDLLWDSM